MSDNNDDDEEEIALIACIPRATKCPVDSIPTECHFCGAELQISKGMVEEKPNGLHCCFPCVATQMAAEGKETQGCVTERSQDVLRSHGLTDEQIAEAKDNADALLGLLSWMQS
jgi:hypothetical protein